MILKRKGDFEENLRISKKRCITLIVCLSLALGAVWALSEYNIIGPTVTGSAKMMMQYASMLITGFCIWYGFFTYDKTAKILRRKEDVEEKQENYLKAKDFQNVFIYVAWVLDIILYALSCDYQFGLTSVCCLIFSLGCIPSYSKFEEDFFKPIYLDEEMKNVDDEDDDD